MALFSHRPKIKLRAPSRVVREGVVIGNVELEVKRPTRVTHLRVALEGREEARLGSGESSHRVSMRYPSLVCDFPSPGLLEKGQHSFKFKIDLPKDYGPSYDGTRCHTEYQLVVDLGVPWWFGRVQRYDLVVTHGRQESLSPSEAELFASSGAGPTGTRAYVEGSVASRAVAVGDILRGGVALHNTDSNRYSKLTVSLVGIEILRGKRQVEHREVRRLSLEIDCREAEEGQTFPLAMRLPETMAPSTTAQLWELQWDLEVSARVRLGRDAEARLPLQILPYQSQRARKREGALAPAVGSARLKALWRDVATHQGLHFDGSRMLGACEPVSYTIGRARLDKAGWCLVAQLSYPSLGIGLEIGEASLLRGGRFGGLRIGLSTWDRKHRVQLRDPGQSQALAEHLKAALGAFAQVEMDDEQARLVTRDSGLRGRRLAAFCEATAHLAEAVAEVGQSLPPPTLFESELESWRRFADELDGELERASMRVRGRYGGFALSCEQRWDRDGEHEATLLRAEGLARGEQMPFLVHLDDEGANLDGELIEVLEPLKGVALWIDWNESSIELGLPPDTHPDAARSALPILDQLARRRGPLVGPYR